MRCILTAALLLLGTPQILPAAEPAAAARTDRAAFDAEIARLRAGATDADLHALRMQYAALPGFTGTGWADDADAMKALDAGDAVGALKLAEAQLAVNYLDPRAHLVAFGALTSLGRDTEAARNKAMLVGILRSISDHGDGRSAATAWTVISVSEEYDLMRILGLKIGRQALRSVDGRNFDVISVTDASGAGRELWFNIDLFFGKGFGN